MLFLFLFLFFSSLLYKVFGIWKEFNNKNNNVEKEKKEITVTLRDGKTIKAIAWETTPWMIVEGISKQLAGKTVVAKVWIN